MLHSRALQCLSLNHQFLAASDEVTAPSGLDSPTDYRSASPVNEILLQRRKNSITSTHHPESNVVNARCASNTKKSYLQQQSLVRNETGESILGQIDEQQEQQARRRNLSAPGRRYGHIAAFDTRANCFSAAVIKSHSDNEVPMSETPSVDIGTMTSEQNTPHTIDTTSSQNQHDDVPLSSSAPHDSDSKKFINVADEDNDDKASSGS